MDYRHTAILLQLTHLIFLIMICYLGDFLVNHLVLLAKGVALMIYAGHSSLTLYVFCKKNGRLHSCWKMSNGLQDIKKEKHFHVFLAH